MRSNPTRFIRREVRDMTLPSSVATLPGPRPVPVLGWRGNAVRFLLDPIGYMDALPRVPVAAFTAGGGGPVIVRTSGAGDTIFALGPASTQTVLGQPAAFHSARIEGPRESRSFFRLTSGLFSMNDGKHLAQRRLIQPAFSKKRLEGYRDDMVAITARTLDRMVVGGRIDLLAAMQQLTLEIANKALFGRDSAPGVHNIGAMIEDVTALAMNPLTMIPLNLPLTPRRRLIDLAARVEASLRAQVAVKREAGGHGDDVLSALLRSRDEDGTTLTEDELIGQLFLLFFAGHDTTRTALAWTLFLLAQHPAVLADVLDELHGVLGGDAPSVAQLGRLPLLERVLKESMRLFPPAPLTGRITVTPVMLGGREFRAGTEVILSFYHSHRDPDLYPEPLRFRPARWESFSPGPHEYVPFGGGVRMCIGAGFAMMEAKIVLAMLLQRFCFALDPAGRFDRKCSVVLSLRHGLPVLLGAQDRVVRARTVVRGDVHEMVDLRG